MLFLGVCVHSCLYCCCRFHSLYSEFIHLFIEQHSWNVFNIKLLCCLSLLLFFHINNIWHPSCYCLHFLPFLGAQIIDLMMLVVDVVKGVQTQTAECLLIGELTCPRMVVVLNKIDLLPPNKRQSAIEKMTKRMHKTLESTRSVFQYK